MRHWLMAFGTVLLSAFLAMMMAPAAVHAQTVEECYAERDKLQRWIGEQEDQNRYEHAEAVIERADLAAIEGDGKKCMELIKEAEGAAHSFGRN